jgi:hypothetical protein
MTKPRREMSPRRVAKSVRTHEATTQALSNAAGWGSRRTSGGVRMAYSRRKSNREIFVPGQGNVTVDKGPEKHNGVGGGY